MYECTQFKYYKKSSSKGVTSCVVTCMCTENFEGYGTCMWKNVCMYYNNLMSVLDSVQVNFIVAVIVVP